jgi:DNA helicase-2/ATP-dependent DNA helicase PcrA
MTVPSPFLMELPRDEMQIEEPSWNSLHGADNEWSQLPHGDQAWESSEPLESISFDPAALEFPLPDSPAPAGLSVGTVTTAAALMGDSVAASEVSPEVFRQGMVVTHPEYGLGKIVALSGSLQGRKATVAFASGAGQKTFVLRMSPLRPAKQHTWRPDA